MPMKIGIQLYSVREHGAKDPLGTLKAMAEAGYEGVQFAGYYGYDARELAGILDGLGISAAGAHVGFGELDDDAERQFDYAKALGLDNITIPIIDPAVFLKPETFEKLAKILETAKKYGIRVSYHNHHHEFAKADGLYRFDRFFAALPDIKVELDTYWAAFAGADPIACMEKYTGRLLSIHIKDMEKDPAQRDVNAVIAEGCLPVAEYLNKAEACGAEWAFVEFDRCGGDEIACVEASRRNLRAMGR